MCTPVCGSGDGAGPVIGRVVVLKPELLLRCECRFMKVQCCVSVKVKLFFSEGGGMMETTTEQQCTLGNRVFSLFSFFHTEENRM